MIPVFSMMMPVIRLNVFELTKERGEVYKTFTSMMLTRSYNSGTAQLAAQPDTVLMQMSAQTSPYNYHWSFWALLIWAAGILASFFRVVVGRISILHMNKEECLNECKVYGLMLKQLSKRMGIDKEIVLLKSTAYRSQPMFSDRL
jgi:hypothetical protein